MGRLDGSEVADSIELMKATLNLPESTGVDHIQELMGDLCSLERLRRLGPLELQEYAVLLASYGFFLTQEENKINARIQWCSSNIDYIVGREIMNIDGWYQEKVAHIKSTIPEAQRLDTIMLEEQAKVGQIRFLSQKLQYIADQVKNLAYQKSRQGRDGG